MTERNRSLGWIGHLRGIRKLLLTLVWMGVTTLSLVIMAVLGLLSRRLLVRVHRRWIRIWARTMAWIVGMRVEVDGTPPRPPFFLVTNHLSYLDVIALWTSAETLFLGKAEIARWPLIGFLARLVGTLFIDRERKTDLVRVLEEVQRELDLGRGVTIFPEGTNTRGDRVYRFNPSVFEVPFRAGRPVHCAALTYRTPPGSAPAHEAVCWWADETFFGHFYRMLTLPSFHARISFVDEPVRGEDRKSMAAAAQAAVESRFVPVVQRPAEVVGAAEGGA